MTISRVDSVDQANELLVKFDFTPMVSSLTNSKFALWTASATPVEVASPFRAIDVYNDYNSISRTLRLYLLAELTGDTDYNLLVHGVQNVVGATLADDSAPFTTDSDITPPHEPTPDVVNIIDHSIKTTSLMDPDDSILSMFNVGTTLGVLSSDPASGEYGVEGDRNNGRLTIRFSERPDPDSVVIRAQRKKVQQGASRWETVDARVTVDSSDPLAYVDFPSDDVSPVYFTAGHQYFLASYRYRVVIPKSVNT